MSLEETLKVIVEEAVEKAVRKALASVGPETLSTEEAASYAKRSPKTVREWIVRGELPAQKRGRSHRIRREDLDAFLAGSPPENDPIVASLKRA